jgi:hypothetical protein
MMEKKIMADSTFRFSLNELNISVSQIEDVMGYKEGEDRTLVTDLIMEILKESEHISNIKSQYAIFRNVSFDNDSKSVIINKVGFQINKIVYGQIKKSDSVAIFLCTAGKEIGIRSRKAMEERDFLRGYIYDVVGSEIVEAAADIMQNELEKEVFQSGKKITNRYSPGYCSWNVSEQHKLFQMVPDNFCGIKLTESALMDPVKSISGFIGIGTNVKFNPYTCSLCDMKDCLYRKKRVKD